MMKTRVKRMPYEDVVFASKEYTTVTIVATYSDLVDALSCNHEEADTKLFVHVHCAVIHNGLKRDAILSNARDIVVIVAAIFHERRSIRCPVGGIWAGQ